MLDELGREILRLADNYILYKMDVKDGLYWLFDIDNGSCFTLNKVSHHIVASFNGGISNQDILKDLIAFFPDENPDKVTNDFIGLISNMKDQNVLIPIEKMIEGE